MPNRHVGYEALVEDPQVDAVYVATPHPMHHEDALLALRAGKHVLVEKPFTMNAAEAEELVAEARARGLFLMEAMWTRFLPHIAEIRRLLAEGALGEIVTVTADHGQWFAEDPAFRLFAPELGGGALLDLGIYPVSFASMVLGTPDPRRRARRPGVHRRRRADLDPARLRERRARRADLHAARRRARRARRSSAPRRGSRSRATSTRRRRSR